MMPTAKDRWTAGCAGLALFALAVLAPGCGRPPDEASLRFLGFRESAGTDTITTLSGELNDGSSDSVDAAFENASSTVGTTTGSTGTGIYVTSARIDYKMSGYSPPSAEYPCSLYLAPSSVSSGTTTYTTGTLSDLPLASASLKNWLIKTGAFSDPERTPTVNLTAQVTFSAKTEQGAEIEVSGSIVISLANTATTTSATDTTVSVSKTGDASKAGTAGGFTVSRTGSTAAKLTVNFTTSGTATAGTDYTAIGSSVVIAAGSKSASITVTALSTGTAEKTLILTLSTSTSYTVDFVSSATVKITS